MAKSKQPKKAAPARKGRSQTAQPKLPSDYIWKVLGWVHQGLAEHLDEELNNRLNVIIRTRDISAYLDLCESVSLQKYKYTDISVDHLRAIRMITLAEKFPFEHPEIDRSKAALKKFRAAELSCALTNQVSSWPFRHENSDLFEAPVLEFAQSFIKTLLGDEPDMVSIYLKGRHGPGSHLSTERSRTSSFDKFASWPYDVTPKARNLLIDTIMSDSRWFRSLLADYLNDPTLMRMGYQGMTVKEIYDHFLNTPELRDEFWVDVIRCVDYNRISLVPKSAKTHRTIALEPMGNVYLQLSIDRYIRRQLKSFGIDLSRQDKNNNLAKEGAIHNHLSTLDLSAASDTVSTGVLKYLLPEKWYNLLDSLRCPFGKLPDGSIIEYQKMSSMGNGYTFVLETLIFAAVIYGVYRHHNCRWREMLEETAVYGDDIIVPKRFTDDVVYTLRMIGFKVNSEKSFIEGHIRESCGTDFYKGYDIRPAYLREKPKTVPDVINQYNMIYVRFVTYFGSPPNALRNMWKWVKPEDRLFGPVVQESWRWFFTDDVLPLKFFPKVCDCGAVLHGYTIRRKPSKVPIVKRYFWGPLVNDLSGASEDTLSFKRVFGFSEAPLSRFDVVGRNSPIMIKRAPFLVRYQNGEPLLAVLKKPRH